MTGILETLSAFVWWIGAAAIATSATIALAVVYIVARDGRHARRKEQARRDAARRDRDRLAQDLDECLDRILGGRVA